MTTTDNETPPARDEVTPTTRQLADLDRRMGPLAIGDLSVSRVALARMGARLDGRALSASDVSGTDVDQVFIDGVRFSSADVEQAFRTPDLPADLNPPCLLFDLASLRSVSAPALIEGIGDPSSVTLMNKLNGLLDRVQHFNPETSRSTGGNFNWVNAPLSRSMETTGNGLQAYGYYSAIVAIAGAIKEGDKSAAIIGISNLAAEFTAQALELSLARTGQAMLKNSANLFKGFSVSRAGKLLKRSAGPIGSALTLPFDIYSAITSFKAAANAQGKEAMDHYVSAGFDLVSIGLTVGLGAAALAGFSLAGPLGIVAAILLVIGAEIYRAVRTIDDIDDYIELSIHERLRSGWLVFWRLPLDTDVMNRYLIARTASSHADQLEAQARKWLESTLKDNVESIVNGKFNVTLRPVKSWKISWSEEELPYTLIDQPVIDDEDDVINAAAFPIENLPGYVPGTQGPTKGIAWRLGGGEDLVTGLPDKPNFFHYGQGRKYLTGGKENDEFIFAVPDGTLDGINPRQNLSSLQGEDGTDTLRFVGNHPGGAPGAGYTIDLERQRVELHRSPTDLYPQLTATLSSIEQVQTLAGASSRVTGALDTKQIVSMGQDTINAGPADNTLVIAGSGARVNGGAGKDRYLIANGIGVVRIDEDGEDLSHVEMAWPFERLQSWSIHENTLVISALSDADGDLAEQQVIIMNVYETIAGNRVLKNNKLVFLTQDGYVLFPILPIELLGSENHSVTVQIIARGPEKTLQAVINNREYALSADGESNLFIPRDTMHTTLRFISASDDATCTLYVDYPKEHIDSVTYSYQVTKSRSGHFDLLTYNHFKLSITFKGGKRLMLVDYALEKGRPRTAGSSIMTAPIITQCRLLLVMADGESCNITAPCVFTLSDRSYPGRKLHDGQAHLQFRTGKFAFVRPQVSKSIHCKSTPQTIRLPAFSGGGIYCLKGKGSSYEVFPESRTTLYLSPQYPDQAQPSTWIFNIKDPSQSPEITVNEQTVCVGTIKIVLPKATSTTGKPDRIIIYATSGHKYEISHDQTNAFLYEMNALAHKSIENIHLELRKLRQNSPQVASHILINGLTAQQHPQERVYYDVQDDGWTLSKDSTRPLNTSELQLLPAI
ncbi:calcium-binding protein [Pseudomonas brenneri]|uniref:calcium-binding protein n=1 Tax=Pseudomonas brenneri TaxID=129817 RepID=UPI0028D64719|nr:calcium-binding protein [Pseudomonas brenneri]